MRRIFLGNGTGIATTAAAAALSILTTLTLVAGGVVISRAIDNGDPGGLAPLPDIGEAVGPIIAGAGTPVTSGSDIAGIGSELSAIPGATASDAGTRSPRSAALLDVDKIKGTLATALHENSPPTRMEEIGPIDRIGSIIKDTKTAHSTTDGAAPQTEPAPDPEDDATLDELVGAGEEVGEADAEASEPSYSETVASPSV